MLISSLFTDPAIFIAIIVAALISLTVHEFSHAAAALYFGDDTAQKMGRLTLNPLSHIDPVGFLMVLFIGFGWAKPVPVNPYNFKKDPKIASGVVSVAGPVSNLLMIIISVIFLRLAFPYFGPNNLLSNFLFVMILINVALMVFNLIPIPPLDGSKVLFSILPDKYNDFKYKLSVNGPWLLLIFILADNFLNLNIFAGLFNWVFGLLSRFL